MTAREFLIEWFDLEPERYEQEGNACIKEMIVDESIDEIIRLVDSYAAYRERNNILFEQILREEFLINTQNYPKEYHDLFFKKFNRAEATFREMID